MTPSLRIAIVGDVHDLWQPQLDQAMLQALMVDLVLFVGDFGNEVVPLIQAIASLELPKAVILGNHDAWYSASEWGKKNCPYDRRLEDRVQQQLDLLGDTHVGYGRLDLPEFQLSIVGGRPFTWGGSEWKNHQFYADRYGIDNFEQSAARIIANAAASPYDTVIFLGHNGPFGLGNQPQDICGKDWDSMPGDYGDPDFARAIAATQKNIPLVTFGHMHHRLRSNGKLRKALVELNQTIYFNAASVPRIFWEQGKAIHHFAIADLEQGRVSQASLVWIDQDLQIWQELCLYQAGRQLVEQI